MRFQPAKILVPTDFTAHSRAAADAAAVLARTFRGSLQLLHVVPLSDYIGYIGDAEDPRFNTGELQDAVREQVAIEGRKELARLADEGVPVEFNTIEGPPAAEICEFAVRNWMELIVIGTHGRTGVKRLLIGSVAENVVRHAKIPVLTIHLSDGPGAPAVERAKAGRADGSRRAPALR